MLRAYDKTTGQNVGAVYMPAQTTGGPMTYMVNGVQYIVIAVAATSMDAIKPSSWRSGCPATTQLPRAGLHLPIKISRATRVCEIPTTRFIRRRVR